MAPTSMRLLIAAAWFEVEASDLPGAQMGASAAMQRGHACFFQQICSWPPIKASLGACAVAEQLQDMPWAPSHPRIETIWIAEESTSTLQMGQCCFGFTVAEAGTRLTISVELRDGPCCTS